MQGGIEAAFAVIGREKGGGVGVGEVATSLKVDGKDGDTGDAPVAVTNLLKNRLNSLALSMSPVFKPYHTSLVAVLQLLLQLFFVVCLDQL